MEHFTLPESKFGMTAVNYRLPELPGSFPEQATLAAANALNKEYYEGLTGQQKLFVTSYLENQLDATRAALDAYFTTDPKEAVKIGASKVRTPWFRRVIGYAMAYCMERSKYRLDVDEMARYLHAKAFFDIKDYYPNNDMVFVMPACKYKRAAIKGFKHHVKMVGTGRDARVVEYDEPLFEDPMTAMKMLLVLFPTEAINTAVRDYNAKHAADDSGQGSGGNIMFEIIAVPSGEFIPAPSAPMRTIEHSN